MGLKCPLLKVDWFFMWGHAEETSFSIWLTFFTPNTWQSDSIIFWLTQTFSIWKTSLLHLLHDRWVFLFFFWIVWWGLLCATGIVIYWISLLLRVLSFHSKKMFMQKNVYAFFSLFMNVFILGWLMLSLQICLTSRFLYLWILVMVNIWLRLTKRAAHAVFYLMLYGAYWTFNFFFFAR